MSLMHRFFIFLNDNHLMILTQIFNDYHEMKISKFMNEFQITGGP